MACSCQYKNLTLHTTPYLLLIEFALLEVSLGVTYSPSPKKKGWLTALVQCQPVQSCLPNKEKNTPSRAH